MKQYKIEYLGNLCWSDWNGEEFGKFKAHINSLEIPDEAIIDHDYDSTRVSFELRREETDEEYEKRIDRELEAREKYNREAQERELVEYKRLKEKYGNK